MALQKTSRPDDAIGTSSATCRIICLCETNGLEFKKRSPGPKPLHGRKPSGRKRTRARPLHQILCPVRRLPPKRVAPHPSLAVVALARHTEIDF